ncbi:MAG TPA: hypothetical protein ENK26_05635 [Gammaproteobacteria bacterium]|nr:hypothetical protein [Gammaproteobacteria bacterium]
MRMQLSGASQQQGIALIVGLILVVALTLVGVTAVRLATTDERIAANSLYGAVAFQAAESALTEASDEKTIHELIVDCVEHGCETPREVKRYRYPVDVGGGSVNATAVVTLSEDQVWKQRSLSWEGSSLGVGVANFNVRVFRLQADGEGPPNSNAKARHFLGVGRIVPARSQ